MTTNVQEREDVISLTLHAQERARERGIDFLDICRAVDFGIEISRDSDCRIVKLRKLCVVMHIKSGAIITVYRQMGHKKRLQSTRKKQKKERIAAKHLRKQ